jgi:hypothetical protein
MMLVYVQHQGTNREKGCGCSVSNCSPRGLPQCRLPVFRQPCDPPIRTWPQELSSGVCRARCSVDHFRRCGEIKNPRRVLRAARRSPPAVRMDWMKLKQATRLTVDVLGALRPPPGHCRPLTGDDPTGTGGPAACIRDRHGLARSCTRANSTNLTCPRPISFPSLTGTSSSFYLFSSLGDDGTLRPGPRSIARLPDI